MNELFEAVRAGDLSRVQSLVAADSTLAIFAAAILGNTETLEQLLAGNRSLISAVSSDGWTPLHLAAFFGNEVGQALGQHVGPAAGHVGFGGGRGLEGARAVQDMVGIFRGLVARHKGEVTAEVTVAEALNDKHLEALKNALKGVTGKNVDLAVKINPDSGLRDDGGLTDYFYAEFPPRREDSVPHPAVPARDIRDQLF